MRHALDALFALFDGGLRMEVKSLIGEGDTVAVEARSDGTTKSGKRYENEYHLLLRIREGEIIEIREYTDPMHAVEVLDSPACPLR